MRVLILCVGLNCNIVISDCQKWTHISSTKSHEVVTGRFFTSPSYHNVDKGGQAPCTPYSTWMAVR